MGLDPPTLTTLSPLLHGLAKAQSPHLVLALRPQDSLPEWITHLIYLGPYLRVDYEGEKHTVLEQIRASSRKQPTDVNYNPLQPLHEVGKSPDSNETPSSVQGETCSALLGARNNSVPPSTWEDSGTQKNSQESLKVQDFPAKHSTDVLHIRSHSREGIPLYDVKPPKIGEAIVEMENVLVKYGEKKVLGGWKHDMKGLSSEGLRWIVRRGERWGIFGPNGQLQFPSVLLSR